MRGSQLFGPNVQGCEFPPRVSIPETLRFARKAQKDPFFKALLLLALKGQLLPLLGSEALHLLYHENRAVRLPVAKKRKSKTEQLLHWTAYMYHSEVAQKVATIQSLEEKFVFLTTLTPKKKCELFLFMQLLTESLDMLDIRLQ